MTTMMTLTMGTKHPADYIWVPDTMFVDATKSYMHNVLATNHKVDISAKGEVNWGTRYVLQERELTHSGATWHGTVDLWLKL